MALVARGDMEWTLTLLRRLGIDRGTRAPFGVLADTLEALLRPHRNPDITVRPLAIYALVLLPHHNPSALSAEDTERAARIASRAEAWLAEQGWLRGSDYHGPGHERIRRNR